MLDKLAQRNVHMRESGLNAARNRKGSGYGHGRSGSPIEASIVVYTRDRRITLSVEARSKEFSKLRCDSHAVGLHSQTALLSRRRWDKASQHGVFPCLARAGKLGSRERRSDVQHIHCHRVVKQDLQLTERQGVRRVVRRRNRNQRIVRKGSARANRELGGNDGQRLTSSGGTARVLRVEGRHASPALSHAHHQQCRNEQNNQAHPLFFPLFFTNDSREQ